MSENPTRERQSITAEEVDDKMLDRMFGQPVNMSVDIPIGLPGLNEQIRAASVIYAKKGSQRRTEYTEMKHFFTERVAAELRAQGCIPDKPYNMIKVAFEWFEPQKRRDPDNIRAAAKFVMDGLVWTGIIKNDNLTHVRGCQTNTPKARTAIDMCGYHGRWYHDHS